MKLNCPSSITDDEQRFFWRWNRLHGVLVENEYMDTACWEVDRENSEAGARLLTNSRGVRRPCYNTSVAHGDKTVRLARAVLKYINGESLSLIRGDDVPPVDTGHLCNNPLCVNPEHLVLQTREENMRQSSLHGRRANQKLFPEDVQQIRQLSREGRLKNREIAEKFGVLKQTISGISAGRKWAHLPDNNTD